MNNFRHLSQAELAAYRDESVAVALRREIGRHLLKCPQCRERLPLPTPEQFWSAIMNDEFPEENSSALIRGHSFGTALSPFRQSRLNLAWSGGALIILIGLFFLIWQSSGESTPQEIVQNPGIEDTFSKAELPSPPQSPVDSNKNTSGNTKYFPNESIRKNNGIDLPGSKASIKSGKARNYERKPSQKQERISSTRGGAGAGNCSEDGIEMEFSAEREDLVFKWKKVPNAAKYHLYISDDEEILIDEYETTEQTSFVLRKPLDPAKTYKWKIIITLENGQTVVGPSSKFTISNFQKSRLKTENNKDVAIRCPAND